MGAASMGPTPSGTAAAAAAVSTLYGGRRVLFLGDSITQGTGATLNRWRFSTQAGVIAGSAVAREAVNGGNPGYTSAQLLTVLPGYLSANPTLNHVHIMIGTNDAGASVPMATYQANVMSLVATARAAGCSVSIAKVPPCGAGVSNAVARTAFAEQYNLWLWDWCRQQGIPLADSWGALADPTTGYYLAANDSGDGIHPSNAGHLALAKVVAPAIVAGHVQAPSPVQGVSTIGLLSNPIMPNTSGWSVTAGAGTRALSAAQSGSGLSAGQWQTVTLDNSAGGSPATTTVSGGLNASLYSAGDKILVFSKMWHDDPTDTAGIQINVSNSLVPFGTLVDTSGCVGNPGPVAAFFSIPASPVSLTLDFVLTAQAGQIVTLYFGQTNAFNLTAGGLVAIQ